MVSAKIDDKTKELLIFCGWYLLVIEWRTGFTNPILAGMPVKIEASSDNQNPTDSTSKGRTWFESLTCGGFADKNTVRIMKEDWRVRCPKCGRSKLWSELGGIRQGAYSKGKRLFGWCKGCHWFRFGIVEKVWVDDDGKVYDEKPNL